MRLLTALLATLVLLVAGGCGATGETEPAGRYSLTVVTQGDHVVADGQSTVGPLVVAGGTLTLEPGAEHQGQVLLLGGDLLLHGRVSGGVTVLGGRADVGPDAVVSGEVRHVDGSVVIDPDAQVTGGVTREVTPAAAPAAGSSPVPRLAVAALTALGAAVLAWALARLAPRPLGRVTVAAADHPVVSAAMGTLVLLTAPALLASMALTLVLLPLAVALLVPWALLTAYGVLAVGHALGERLPAAPTQAGGGPGRRATRQGALGTGLLTLLLGLLLATVPLIGGPALLLVCAVGTGAAVLTGLGSHSFTPAGDVEGALRQGRSG
jgi:hypothetical protein